MVIKKIFGGVYDEEIHNDFLKFGRGEFKNRYLIEVKKQADKFSIKTSAEFANFFVKKCLEKLNPNEKIFIKGVIICTTRIEAEGLHFIVKKESNFQGVRKMSLEGDIIVKEILGLMEKYSRIFFALSFNTDKCQLKIKPKAPKSGKPGKKDGEVKADFCSLKTTDAGIVRELLFDVSDFKEVKVNHTIVVENIVYPKDIQSMGPEEVRKKSKRKGKIIRKVNADGRRFESEHEFEA